MVQKIKSIYDLDVSYYAEKEIPIKNMWIYPIIGVKGIRMDHLLVTPEGIVNDRIWVILDKKDLTSVAAHNSVLITFLRCVINKQNTHIFCHTFNRFLESRHVQLS